MPKRKNSPGPWVATHGVHAGHTIQAVIDALKVYINNYDKSWTGHQCSDYWIQEVGGAQRKLPMNLIQTYCRTDRPFDPTSSFTEEALPRTLNYYDCKDSKDKILNLSDLGSKFGLFRWCRQCCGTGSRGPYMEVGAGEVHIGTDRAACIKLLKVRNNQRDKLEASLTQTAIAAPKPR